MFIVSVDGTDRCLERNSLLIKVRHIVENNHKVCVVSGWKGAKLAFIILRLAFEYILLIQNINIKVTEIKETPIVIMEL